MPSIDNYCLKPDYFTGVSQGNGDNVDTANDRWLNMAICIYTRLHCRLIATVHTVVLWAIKLKI